MRPAFRRGGDAAIVPPAAKKSIPAWMKGVWDEAAHVLDEASLWIVVGYSLPPYDHDVRRLLAGTGAGKDVVLLDPASKSLYARWKDVLHDAQISPLQGLPEGLGEIEELLGQAGGVG
ncbi:MAG: hypothetical protein IIB22_11850 [Chloroflexi bacterium]|nr:hypothetical protein [Chloroflexota bacterium]